MTEFLQKNYEGILKQETGISETIRQVPSDARYLLDDKQLIILLGAGDSYAAAEFGKWAFLSVNRNAISLSPTELRRIMMDDKSLVIGITASGRSLATIDALEYARKEGASTIVLTDNPEGTANQMSDNVWLTHSGVKSYNISPTAPTTCAMAYFLKMAEMIQSMPRSKIHHDTVIWAENGKEIFEWAKQVGPKISGIADIEKPLYFVSEGPNYVAAQLGMMKFNEFSLVKGIAILREEFQHHCNLSMRVDDRGVFISDAPVLDADEKYLDVMTKTLKMQVFHLYTPESYLESSLGQAIANTIALQIASYHHLKENDPEKESFKLPHAEAFKIY
jgi:glucosamine 6-phosphate synthetase-like amidotransferase/phosphosugar isomerase protein